MRLTKKTAMVLSFTIGALLLATTALADIVTKSGYDQLKDACKVTAEQCSEKFNSFTIEFSADLKDNGKTIMSTNEIVKYDRSKGASENSSSNENLNGQRYNSQTYTDKTTVIRITDQDPTYYVTEYTKGRKAAMISNPFKEDKAGDLEKIADALIGNLKDNIVVTENSDGSKVLTGSLTEVQIPSLVNAVASFQLKQEFNGNQDNMPHLTKDVFVKKVEGTAKIDKDGVLESILGSAILSGKDEQGTSHDIIFEVLVKVTDINSTAVVKPDLNGKKVVKNVLENENTGPEISNPEKFIGKFKNNILMVKDDKFVKVGERVIEITQIDNETVTGRYYEVYKPGFEEYATTKRDFNINAKKSTEKNSSGYDYTTPSGTKGNFFLDEHGGKIYLNGSVPGEGGLIFDSTFNPAVN